MLELLPGKEFKITLQDGSIVDGKFGTWAYKRFCMKLGLSDKKLVARLSEEESSVFDNIELILCAIESKQRQRGEAFKYTDADICEWVDSVGGIGSETFLKLMAHANSELDSEKKTETT